jgi:xylose isomerase
MDLCARAFLNAAQMIKDGHLAKAVSERYRDWKSPEAQSMLKGELTLEAVAAWAEERNLDPKPRSGKQEQLENLVSRSLF